VSDGTDRQRPLLRVISGEATEEEIAAVLAVVLARSAPVEDGEPAPASTWADPGARLRGVRGVFTPGRHGWRTSYWPR